MNQPIERRAGPSLLGARGGARAGETRAGVSLLELLHEAFYLLFMLRNGAIPPENFQQQVIGFLADFDREARLLRADGDDIDMARYAYCAALDEIVLASGFRLRQLWERRPLQLVLFGDQLAGEHFFDRLEGLRGKGAMRVQALQVFHMCLLLGFKGKYIHDAEKLSYLAARLGDEIAHIKGKSHGFAPRAARPDQIVHKRRGNLPLWAVSSMFALLALCAYLGLRASLAHGTAAGLAPYADLVKLAPRPANLTITLP